MIPRRFVLDPADPRFRDPGPSSGDLAAAAATCRECRKCEGECSVFADLLSAAAGPVRPERFDACCQCLRCLHRCPYGPETSAEGTLDLPRLILRDRVARRGRDGVGLMRRIATDPDLGGAIGSLAAPVLNPALRSARTRAALRRAAGMAGDGPIAPFARVPFDAWFRRRERKLNKRAGGAGGEVALFIGCRVNHRYPEIGRAAVEVLGALGVRIHLPEQRCCGAALLEAGDLDGALENAALHERSFQRHASAGRPIVALETRCVGMARRMPALSGAAESGRTLARSCVDLAAYLLARHAPAILERLPSRPGARIFYHEWDPEGGVSGGLRLVREMPGVEVTPAAECRCGSAERLVAAAEAAVTDRVVVDDLAGAEVFRAVTGARALHAIEFLRERMMGPART